MFGELNPTSIAQNSFDTLKKVLDDNIKSLIHFNLLFNTI